MNADVQIFHLRTNDLPARELEGPLWEILGLEERDRCLAARKPEDRLERWASRLLIRLGLSSVSGLPAAEWRFVHEELGKPQLDPDSAVARKNPDLRFNAAHSGGLVLVAVSRGREVGVDVEDLGRSLGELDELLGFFTARERDAIESTPPAERPQRFLHYWTLKEAVAKADGRGLSVFPSFSIEPGPPPSYSGPQADRWTLAQWKVSPSHVIAAAAQEGSVGGEAVAQVEPTARPEAEAVAAGNSAAQGEARSDVSFDLRDGKQLFEAGLGGGLG